VPDLSTTTALPAIGMTPAELTRALAGMDVLFARPAGADDWTEHGLLTDEQTLAAVPGYDPAGGGTLLLTACGRCARVEFDGTDLLAVFDSDGSDLDPDDLGPFEAPMPAGYRFRLTLDTLVLAYYPGQDIPAG